MVVLGVDALMLQRSDFTEHFLKFTEERGLSKAYARYASIILVNAFGILIFVGDMLIACRTLSKMIARAIILEACKSSVRPSA
jgi:hypothetical protein